MGRGGKRTLHANTLATARLPAEPVARPLLNGLLFKAVSSGILQFVARARITQ